MEKLVVVEKRNKGKGKRKGI